MTIYQTYRNELKKEIYMIFICMYLILNQYRTNKKKWVVGKVVIAGEEMAKFSIDSGKEGALETSWIEIESDKIALLRSKTDNPKIKEVDLLLAFNDQWK